MKKKWVAQGEGKVGQAVSIGREDRSFVRQLAVYLLLAVAALVMPRATVYGGLSPFGVAIAACASGPASVIVYISAAVGYLSVSEVVMPLRYLAALISVAGFRWAFGGMTKVTEHVLFAPLLTAGSTMLTGIAVGSISGFQTDVLLSFLCESVLAGGVAYFFRNTVSIFRENTPPGQLTLPQQSSLMISVSVLLMAINTVMIYDISVGRIFSMAVILFAAKAGQQQGGMLAGVVLGSATALSSPSYAYLAVAYAFGGLITGLFSRFGKIVTALTFTLVSTLASLSTGDQSTVIIAVYEVMTAALLFLAMPPAVDRAANAVFSRAKYEPAVLGMQRAVDMRLTYAANTMKDIAQTVDAVSEKLTAMNTPTIKDVYAPVLRGICAGCTRRNVCWKQKRRETKRVFTETEKMMERNGIVDKSDWGRMMSGECIHAEEMVSLMNDGYSRFIAKEQAARRISDVRSIVTDQFDGMASLLLDLSEDFKNMECIDEQATQRVIHVCQRYRMPVTEAACLIGKRNRLTVELLMEGHNIPDENSRWYNEICDACGCELDAPIVSENGYITKLRMTQKPKYSVRFAMSQTHCENEKLCGDAYEHFFDQEGRFCIVLSDGMGTGGRAAVDGAMTAALTGRMLRAGFRYESVLRIINSALIVKSGDESLSTIDCFQIDLFTGRVHGMKAGAAPSILYSNGVVSKISATSLPVGILKNIHSEEYEDYMRAGDLLVMVSDGVIQDDSQWLEELVSRLGGEDMTEKMIADEILYQANERKGEGRGDDTTVLVLRVC